MCAEIARQRTGSNVRSKQSKASSQPSTPSRHVQSQTKSSSALLHVSASVLQFVHRIQVVHRVSSSLVGPVISSFRALSGRLKFPVRRHKFIQDSLPCCMLCMDPTPARNPSTCGALLFCRVSLHATIGGRSNRPLSKIRSALLHGQQNPRQKLTKC